MNDAMGTTSSRIERQTLPSQAYVDPVWFASEMDAVFASMWLAAGRTADLDRPGAFLRRDVAGASVLIVRSADGPVRAFHNVCRHRGTQLCTEQSGVFRGRIQCPYHAWTYDLDGRLLAAPQMEEVAGFNRSEYPLRQVACEIWDGHIFINLSQSAHRVVYDVAANWKLVVQNYNECLHCPIIHPLLNQMHHYLGADNVPTTDTYCGGAMGFKEGIETLSSDGKRRRHYLPGLGDRERSLVNYFAIYPNLLLTLHPDYMMTITIWPQECGRTRLLAEWLFHPAEMSKPDFVFQDAVEFWDRTNREDWAISEQSYAGISSRGYVPGPYAERERQLWEFDRFVLRALGVSRGQS